MKRNFKKSIICLALVMTMLVGTSLTALADDGTISYGGATFTWDMSMTILSMKLTNRTATTLAVKGTVRETDSGGHYDDRECNNSASSTTSLSYNVLPSSGYWFVEDDGNELKIYVGSVHMATCSPQPY